MVQSVFRLIMLAVLVVGCSAVSAAAGSIPHNIFQVWIGPQAPPRVWMSEWQATVGLAINEGWSYRLFRDEDVASLRHLDHESFDKFTRFDGRADLIRVAILREFGGLYIDADVVPAPLLRSGRVPLEAMLNLSVMADYLDEEEVASTVDIGSGLWVEDADHTLTDLAREGPLRCRGVGSSSFPQACESPSAVTIREFEDRCPFLSNSMIAAQPDAPLLVEYARRQAANVAALTTDQLASLHGENLQEYIPWNSSIDTVQVLGPHAFTESFSAVTHDTTAGSCVLSLPSRLFYPSHWTHLGFFPVAVEDQAARGLVPDLALTYQFGYSTNSYWKGIDFGLFQSLDDFPVVSLIADAVSPNAAMEAVAQAAVQDWPQARLEIVVGMLDVMCLTPEVLMTTAAKTAITVRAVCLDGSTQEYFDAEARRDQLLAHATGEIVMHWRADGSTVHSASRVSVQARPLVRHDADVVVTIAEQRWTLNQDEESLLKLSDPVLPHDADTYHTSETVAEHADPDTLCYRRSLWSPQRPHRRRDVSSSWLDRVEPTLTAGVNVVKRGDLDVKLIRSPGYEGIDHDLSNPRQLISKRANGTTTPKPSPHPTRHPTSNPTVKPTSYPTAKPSPNPTPHPTPNPTPKPTTPFPTAHPTPNPTTPFPTPFPTSQPTHHPTVQPTAFPTMGPTDHPTPHPTAEPTPLPTRQPTATPTLNPTRIPTAPPVTFPTPKPTPQPTTPFPTQSPTTFPTLTPTPAPTPEPTVEGETGEGESGTEGEGGGEGEAGSPSGEGESGGGEVTPAPAPRPGAGGDIGSGSSAMLNDDKEGDSAGSSGALSTGSIIGGVAAVFVCILVLCAFLVGRRSARRRYGKATMATELSSPEQTYGSVGGLAGSRSGSARRKRKDPSAMEPRTYGAVGGAGSTYAPVSLARGDGQYRAMPGSGVESGGEYRAVPSEAGGSYGNLTLTEVSGEYGDVTMTEAGGDYTAVPVSQVPRSEDGGSTYSPVPPASVTSDTVYRPIGGAPASAGVYRPVGEMDVEGEQ